MKAHPDLQQDLDLLLQTKLPIEEISFEEKETLLSTSMKLNSVDEDLFLYLDNELNETQKKVVEEKLKEDKTFQLQYSQLLKTKPVSLDKIVYPNKKELYRYEERKPFPVYWMRIAAAVVVILGMGIFLFTYQPKPGIAIADGVEKTQPVKEINSSSETKTEVAVKTESKEPVKPTVIKKGETDDAPNIVRTLKKKQQQKQIEKQPVALPAKAEPELADNGQKETEQNNVVVNKKPEVSSQQTINNTPVTPPSITSLNNQTTTSAVTAVQTDVVKIDNEKKSSLKGFLRKATRFIERRTNISTTNENNELLIGAVALKL